VPFTLEAGDRVVFRADRILELELGSAGAVDLEVNGERVQTGSLGDVVHSSSAGRTARSSRPSSDPAPPRVETTTRERLRLREWHPSPISSPRTWQR
jgi:RodZ C-terminal domain